MMSLIFILSAVLGSVSLPKVNCLGQVQFPAEPGHANHEWEMSLLGVSKLMRLSSSNTSTPWSRNNSCLGCDSRAVNGSKKAKGLPREYALAKNSFLKEKGGFVTAIPVAAAR